MLTDIFHFSNIIVWIANLSALTFAILYAYKEGSPGYLRLFPPYLLVSIGIEMLSAPLFNNLFILFEIGIFGWFLFMVLRSPLIKKALVTMLIIFAAFFVITSFPHALGAHLNDRAVILESIIIIIPCLFYYRELFARPDPVDLPAEPSFWLVTGVFFYLATIFPFFVVRPYLVDLGFKKIATSLYAINNFALSITYILFIKGYTCRIKKS